MPSRSRLPQIPHDDVDMIVGLEMGADDYVVKPFNPRALAARVRAVLRRMRPRDVDGAAAGRIVAGDLIIDEERFEATCHDRPLSLTPTEFRILAALARDVGKVLSRGQLLDRALGESYDGYDRTIDAHVKNLRRKLAAAGAGEACAIVTVHGS